MLQVQLASVRWLLEHAWVQLQSLVAALAWQPYWEAALLPLPLVHLLPVLPGLLQQSSCTADPSAHPTAAAADPKVGSSLAPGPAAHCCLGEETLAVLLRQLAPGRGLLWELPYELLVPLPAWSPL